MKVQFSWLLVFLRVAEAVPVFHEGGSITFWRIYGNGITECRLGSSDRSNIRDPTEYIKKEVKAC
jgi:hypothetical protein